MNFEEDKKKALADQAFKTMSPAVENRIELIEEYNLRKVQAQQAQIDSV